jgi:ATP-dependent Clp protease ATP-binding subunit ClpA
MRISPEVEIALSVAANDAARRRHEYITIEHLLYALLLDETTAGAYRHAGGDPAALKKRLEQYLSEQLEPLAEDAQSTPTPSLGVQRAIRRAATHVKSSGKEEVTGANVLIAMFAERDSFAVALMEEQGVTRLDVVSYVSHGFSKLDEDDSETNKSSGAEAGEEGPRPAKDPLKAYTINLNEEALNARIDPLVGRENEVARIVQILARRKKNNPLLVGDAGVGKTAIASPRASR